ncbi:MAG: ester cyclase [bacterium]|nr:ester cyclase [bacterium]
MKIMAELAPIDLITSYYDAAAAGDANAMARFRADGFVFDAVHRDAAGRDPFNAEGSLRFWRAWFDAFSEFDWEIVRAIVADDVVVMEWVFTGKQDGKLDELIGLDARASGRVVRFRGTTFYDVAGGQIVRETMYMDLATLMVELEVTP